MGSQNRRKFTFFFPDTFVQIVEGTVCPFCRQGRILLIPLQKAPNSFVLTCSNTNCYQGNVRVVDGEYALPPMRCVEVYLDLT